MLEFLRRNRLLATAALFLMVAAALIVRTSASRLRDDRLGRLFLELMAPLQRGATAASRAVADVRSGAVDLWRARQEVEGLRARVRDLERDAANLAETQLENDRLRTLLDFRRTLHGELLTARVIGHDASGLSRTITIDQGTTAGIVKGAAVLAPGGLVGQVFLASPHAARVLLVTDHNSGVDAVVQRTRGRGIVEGTIEGRCGLKFVKRTEDLQVGDLVLSSGLDGIFPPGLPVGRIDAVDKQGQGLFQYAQIEPAVNVDRLEEVLVTLGPVRPAVPPADLGLEQPANPTAR
ncbi:MAG TPA: rod shape-determining protein MreC [Candidatus Binatia bacterium]|nr:rod shape-determining protein MreC [Candidatus Binatia bacterium]